MGNSCLWASEIFDPGTLSMGKIRKRLNRIAQKLNVANSFSPSGPEESDPSTVDKFEKEFDELKQIAEDNYNRFLTTTAKLEDYKKRTENEKAEFLKYGTEDLMRDILPFIDSLEKAVEHGQSKKSKNRDALIEGIQLAIKDVKRISKQYGWEPEESVEGSTDTESPRDQDETDKNGSPPTESRERIVVMDGHPDDRSIAQGDSRRDSNAIIAVGGAKGGVGKTILAANLAVALGNLGQRVIAIDLDLGGSNLDLYMGRKGLARSLNDFLCNRELNLSDVVMRTNMKNLSLIGGNNSLLGTANLQFGQKLKLIRAMRELEADIIVLDLGGDTAFNVLDFYLQADVAIVVSSPEPTSYLDAYNFIKVALLRRLSRFNGPEFRNGRRLPHPVQALLREAIDWQGEKPFTTVVNLLDQIEQIDPDSRTRLEQVLLDYRPYLVFNMARTEKQCQLIYDRIRETGEKMLGVSIAQLGPIPEDESVRKSVRTLKPLLTVDQTSSAAKAITNLGQHLLEIIH